MTHSVILSSTHKIIVILSPDSSLDEGSVISCYKFNLYNITKNKF